MAESVSFDRAASFYNETRGFPNEDIAGRAGQFIATVGQLDKNSHVLEIGIGTGRISIPLAAYVRSVFGVDISEQMLRVLLETRSESSVFPAQSDATMLPFSDNTFDAVVATHVFHLIPNWEQALREVQRVLKPDRPLLHCFNWNNEISALRNRAFTKISEPENVGVKSQDLPGFLPATGWTRTEKVKYEYQYKQAPDSLVEQVQKRIWSSTWRMSDEDIQQAVERMNVILQEEFEDPSQPIDVTGSFNVVVFHQPGL
jgi:ubiquinone/menaquinone biosynthesis C-methylase UbiE